MVKQLRTQLRQQQDDAHFRITELNNQLIRTTTNLKNELIEKTTGLANELIRTKTELNNEVWRITVNSANELAGVRAVLDSAEGRLGRLREAVAAHNERLAAVSIELRAQGVNIDLEPCKLSE